MVIEKPVAMNLAELNAIRDAVVKAKVKSQVGFVARWNPHIQSIRNMIGKGGLGDLYYTEVDYYHEIGPWWSGWRWGASTREGGPSASLVAGCHAVDLLYCFGGEGSVLNEKSYTKNWFPGQQGWQHFNTTFLDSGDVTHHPFQAMMDDLAIALIEDKEATANIHEAYKSHEICLAIDRSIETGQAVKLPLTEQ